MPANKAIREKVMKATRRVNQDVRFLQAAKKDHPELKQDFTACPGGILNAYREGDITFDEALWEIVKLVATNVDNREDGK